MTEVEKIFATIIITIMTIGILFIGSGSIYNSDYDTYFYSANAKIIEVHENKSLIEFKDCNGVKRRQWIDGAHEAGTIVEVSFKYKVKR